jgi:putative membrane protein
MGHESLEEFDMLWGWMHGGYGAPFWLIGPAMMGGLWIAIIVGVVFLVRSLVRQGHRPERDDSALEILQKRYARGEISKEEYEAKRKDIQ